jgi:hypothetical protein
MAEKEVVLEMGVEGGGVTIFRTPADSGWLLYVEGSSMFLDDNDEEDWRSSATGPVNTIDEALRSVSKDGSWVIYYPISVHPEYGKTVWELAQLAARTLPEHLSHMWKRKTEVWRRCCLRDDALSDSDRKD